MRALFMKAPGNVLIAADQATEDYISSKKSGQGFKVEITQARNIGFHRKFFLLLQFAYDIWEPSGERQWKGNPIQKDFEGFREYVTILAGHYTAVYGLDGGVQLKAKTISFAGCSEEEFHIVYNGVLDVVWDKIFSETNYRSKAEVSAVIDRLLGFSG